METRHTQSLSHWLELQSLRFSLPDRRSGSFFPCYRGFRLLTHRSDCPANTVISVSFLQDLNPWVSAISVTLAGIVSVSFPRGQSISRVLALLYKAPSSDAYLGLSADTIISVSLSPIPNNHPSSSRPKSVVPAGNHKFRNIVASEKSVDRYGRHAVRNCHSSFFFTGQQISLVLFLS